MEGLEALQKFYTAQRQPDKAKRTLEELNALRNCPQYGYFVEVESGPALGGKLRSIAAAAALYDEGIQFKDYPALPDSKKKWLEKALNNFRQILQNYPESTRVGAAAFRMGEIYAGWYYQDYSLAARYFEACARWDPDTKFNARFRAAELYDRKVINWHKAKSLYEDCVAHSPDPNSAKKAKARLDEVERLQAMRP